MKYVWIEEDYFVSGSGKEINISGSIPIKVKIFGVETTVSPTLALKWSIGNDDDDAGNNLVQFEDPITHVYSTGKVEWKEKN